MTTATTALPQLQRPSPELGLQFAAQLFVRGDRVDMAALATALGVGRTTVYRWLGDREQVISEVLVRLSTLTWQHAEATATGEGVERVLCVVRTFMEQASQFPPLITFVQQEPQAALRVLLDADSSLMRWLREQTRATAATVLELTDETSLRVDDAITMGVSLLWPAVVIGRTPDMAMLMRVLRVQIA